MRTALRPHHLRWTGERDLAHAIYGTVVGTAAMATAGAHRTLGGTVATVLVTVAVYWVAERYADALAAAVRGPDRRARIGRALRQGWPTIEAACAPPVVLVAFVLVTGDLRAGVVVALAVSTVMLSALGHAAAKHAGATRLVAVGCATGSAVLGVVVILLKTFLH
ncbi:hypothetical protein V5P93_003371 [Actinokineospora auranticolor]|uniref:Integral membrane protein n=1 Tax=Actinokineospora auranticolor TaxID=155976 RepID=A0A2S6GPC8_9PSEU|nr:hypothetical protein [Actinokineospora auranticolor]PPK67030.1 hypothetical protein CLV40_10827 [Actinokineospora auranticolor]